MTTRVAFTLALLLLPSSAARAQDTTAATSIAALSEPTTPTTLVENAQTRLVKVSMLANSTRGMHGHPDMQFHVFITMDWPIILTIQGTPKPLLLGPWQAHFFTGGVVHAITNPNPSPVQFLEFFTKKTAGSASNDGPIDGEQAEAAAKALALAFAAGR